MRKRNKEFFFGLILIPLFHTRWDFFSFLQAFNFVSDSALLENVLSHICSPFSNPMMHTEMAKELASVTISMCQLPNLVCL